MVCFGGHWQHFLLSRCHPGATMQPLICGAGDIADLALSLHRCCQVSYSAFKEFVSSREQGLREAFSQFDLGEGCRVGWSFEDTRHCRAGAGALSTSSRGGSTNTGACRRQSRKEVVLGQERQAARSCVGFLLPGLQQRSATAEFSAVQVQTCRRKRGVTAVRLLLAGCRIAPPTAQVLTPLSC